jgi:hypothetical protein
MVRIVGGAGGFLKSVPAKYYENVPFRTVLQDMCISVGESLSANSVPSQQLAKWVRESSSFGLALRSLLSRHASDLSYRFNSDGALNVLVDTWPSSGAKLQGLEEYNVLRKFACVSSESFIYPGTTIDLSQYTLSPVLKVSTSTLRSNHETTRFDIVWED